MDRRVAPILRSYDDLESASRALAWRVVERVRGSLAARGRCALGLSGGSTPETLFQRFSGELRSAAPWDLVDYFWVDERAVPPTDPRSNYGLANRVWLGPRSIPAPRIHRIRGEAGSAPEAAREYETELRGYPPQGSKPLGATLLDVALLGMGTDGHTASLFPGSKLLADSGAQVGVDERPALEPFVPRITLTLPALNRSRFVGFLVAGKEKRAPLRQVFLPPSRSARLPAGQVRGVEGTEWFVDRAAAASLDAIPHREANSSPL